MKLSSFNVEYAMTEAYSDKPETWYDTSYFTNDLEVQNTIFGNLGINI